MIPNFQISNYHLDRDIEHNISGYIYIYILISLLAQVFVILVKVGYFFISKVCHLHNMHNSECITQNLMCFFGSKVFHLHIMHNSDYRISEYYVLFWVQKMPTRVKLLDFLSFFSFILKLKGQKKKQQSNLVLCQLRKILLKLFLISP